MPMLPSIAMIRRPRVSLAAVDTIGVDGGGFVISIERSDMLSQSV